ncbi:hypothetical protein, partial [Oceanospirillum sediminis]
VFVNGDLVGVTGSNFGTDGFIKTHVKAGEEHIVLAEKDGLSDSKTLTPEALGINNFDLVLADSNNSTITPAIFTASNTYQLDAPGGAFDLYHRSEYMPVNSHYSFSSEKINRGIWIGMWGQGGVAVALNQWLQADFPIPISISGFTPVGPAAAPERTPHTITIWVDQGEGLEEYQTFSMDGLVYKDIWFNETLNDVKSIRFHMNESQGYLQGFASSIAVDEIFILK